MITGQDIFNHLTEGSKLEVIEKFRSTKNRLEPGDIIVIDSFSTWPSAGYICASLKDGRCVDIPADKVKLVTTANQNV